MRYALVTGATGGLGGEVAKALAEKGWYVFASERSERALQELMKKQWFMLSSLTLRCRRALIPCIREFLNSRW